MSDFFVSLDRALAKPPSAVFMRPLSEQEIPAEGVE